MCVRACVCVAVGVVGGGGSMMTVQRQRCEGGEGGDGGAGGEGGEAGEGRGKGEAHRLSLTDGARARPPADLGRRAGDLGGSRYGR